jgi:hypothetical protein
MFYFSEQFMLNFVRVFCVNCPYSAKIIARTVNFPRCGRSLCSILSRYFIGAHHTFIQQFDFFSLLTWSFGRSYTGDLVQKFANFQEMC